MGESRLRRETQFDSEIKSDDDRRLAESNARLFRRLRTLTYGKIMTQQLYDQACDLVEAHATEARQHGIRFPEMAVIYLPGVRAIEVVRADWEPQDIQTWAVNLTAKFPQITPREIAEALARHFPAYAKRVDEMARREPLPRVEHVGGERTNSLQ